MDFSLDFNEQKNGISWAGKKVHAIVKKDWDIRRFPFDEQQMTVELEESDQDAGTLVYVADTANTRLDPKLALSNWKIERFEISTGTHKYETTYGDPVLTEGSEYPRAALTVFIKRKSRGLFFSLFTGLYVAFFISSLVFFIDPIEVDPRFGLSVGGLFAAVGNKYIVDSILPQSTTFTLVDKLHILTYVFCCCASCCRSFPCASGKTVIKNARRGSTEGLFYHRVGVSDVKYLADIHVDILTASLLKLDFASIPVFYIILVFI